MRSYEVTYSSGGVQRWDFDGDICAFCRAHTGLDLDEAAALGMTIVDVTPSGETVAAQESTTESTQESTQESAQIPS